MLSCSPNIKHEYCCTIVKIEECLPIEGADRIQQTLVNGMSMVISRDIKPGDIMIYAANETALHPDFLRVNNLYGIGDYELNSNSEEIAKLKETEPDKAKALCGFFTSQNRVKLLKLKGIYSFGFLFRPEMLAKWYPAAKTFDFSSHTGEDFDTVGDELFVKAYVPAARTPKGHVKGTGAPAKKVKFDRLVDGQFKFHYDSQQLQRVIQKIQPIDKVAISVKIHGTSAIFGKVCCKIPDRLPLQYKIWNSLAKLLRLPKAWMIADYHFGQDNVYASRTVLKNRYVDVKNPQNTTTNDIWGQYNTILAPFIPESTIVYGEIFGYQQGTSTCIQKGYDYGLPQGESRFMPYRIVHTDIEGSPDEWEVSEVRKWTEELMEKYPSLQTVLYPIPILYEGTLADLYSDVKQDENWYKNILANLKTDKVLLGMETNESLCKNKVPREGICVRIIGDKVAENFKLKCDKFLGRESKNIDAGEVDIEMQESNYA